MAIAKLAAATRTKICKPHERKADFSVVLPNL